MNYWIYWIYGTDLFDGKEFAIDGATQHIIIIFEYARINMLKQKAQKQLSAFEESLRRAEI